MTNTEEGPDMVSFRELARRLAADDVAGRVSHQQISRIAREDPGFPPVVRVGSSKAVDYGLARAYFAARVKHPGWRTDVRGRLPAAV